MRRYLNKIWPRRQSPRPAIVMYHRVANLSVDPWGLAVKPENFNTQVALFSRYRTILPLEEFVLDALAGKLPRDALALTFDDGYHDNLTNAGQTLARANMPATLFLASGPTECGTGYWWDEIAAMILDAPPMAATIEIAGLPVAVALGPRETADDARQGWRAWEPRTAREQLHYDLWDRIRPLTPAAIDQALVSLRSVFETSATAMTRAMTIAEVGMLIAKAPVVLGGHTHDHVDLQAVDQQTALDQMLRGRDIIQELTGSTPVGFAYPYGRNDRATRILAKVAGFAWACTTEQGFVDRRIDRFRLPRIAAPDVPHIDWLA